jgi:hypothetical protein
MVASLFFAAIAGLAAPANDNRTMPVHTSPGRALLVARFIFR